MCRRLTTVVIAGALLVGLAVPAVAGGRGWESTQVEENGPPQVVDIGAGTFEYKVEGEGLVAIFCESGSMIEFPDAPGGWDYLASSGKVTGPCSLVMEAGHTHNPTNHEEDDHDDHDHELTFSWRPVPVRSKVILTGSDRGKHKLGELPDGTYRIRNFRGMQISVWSSEDGRCGRPRSGDRIIVVIGDRCDGDIEIRVRNPQRKNYRLWVTKIR